MASFQDCIIGWKPDGRYFICQVEEKGDKRSVIVQETAVYGSRLLLVF